MPVSQTSRATGVFLFASLLPIVAHAADLATSIVGTRYGIGQPSNPNMLWLEQWRPDGSVTIKTRLCLGTTAVDHQSTGRWRVSGQQEFIVFDEPNGSQTKDTYEVVFEKGSVLREVMTESNRINPPLQFVWHSTKVADDFEFPTCNPIS